MAIDISSLLSLCPKQQQHKAQTGLVNSFVRCFAMCFHVGGELPLSEPTKKDMGDGGHAGPSKRRRERRLRHFLRHERLTVAMLLAEREGTTPLHGVYGGFWENFTFYTATLFALGNVVHSFLYILKSGSLCFCVWVLPLENRIRDSSGDAASMLLTRNAWLDSGLIFCTSAWLR